mgnify:CR=1 FL=1
MSSSTSSSDAAGLTSGKVFVAIVVVLAVGLLVALEYGVRTFRSFIDDRDANYVLRVLTEPGKNVIIGDSHLIPVGRPDGWVNFARAGLAPPEGARILAARHKFVGIDRVVIESGPQILMDARQFEFRALPPETLTRQIFPEPVMIFEPSILDAALDTVVREATSVVSTAHAEGRKKKSGKKKKSADTPEARRAFATGRVLKQNPAADYDRSLAWHRHWDIVEALTDAGVQVCLVQTPVMAGYLKTAGTLDGALYFPALAALTAEAERRNIRYIEADELAMVYPDKLFANADHLNRRGGEVFWKEVEAACFAES